MTVTVAEYQQLLSDLQTALQKCHAQGKAKKVHRVALRDQVFTFWFTPFGADQSVSLGLNQARLFLEALESSD